MKLRNPRSGQGIFEYALLIALLAFVSILALTNMGYVVSTGLMGNISSTLSTANDQITGS